MKKTNKSFNTTWSDGDSDETKDAEYHVSHHVALTTRSVIEKSSAEDDQSRDPKDVPAYDSDSNDREKLTDEAIIESYRTMYQKWLQVVKINERLTKQVAQINVEKNDLLNKNMLLKGNLTKSQKIKEELSEGNRSGGW